MAVIERTIFYPEEEEEIIEYYDKAVKKLIGLAFKYGIPTTLLNILTDYSFKLMSLRQVNASRATTSMHSRREIFDGARAELMRELKRLTSLSNFDERDAIAIGIRKERFAYQNHDPHRNPNNAHRP
jgi:hypothetical protein